MKKFISVIITAALVFIPSAFPDSAQTAVYGHTLASAESSDSSVSAPKADKKSGLYLCDGESLKVNLSCSTKNADIYYKIDNGKYKKYTKTIDITKNSMLSAYAKLSDKKSKTVTYEYRLGANFFLSNYGGNFDENQTVKITTKVPGVTFRYTLNGERVTEKSKKFPEKGLKIENTAELSVSAYKDSWNEVGHYELEYNINKLDNYKVNFYYDRLSDKEKKGYERIHTAILNCKETVALSDIQLSVDETRNVVRAVPRGLTKYVYVNWYDNWYSWHFENNKCAEIYINYGIKNVSEIKKAQKKLEEKAAKIIAEAERKSSAYDKIKYIHDWIVNNSDYVSAFKESEAKYADGPIVKGIGNCNGYARAFWYLTSSLGFDCIYVEGTVYGDEWHSWNRIKLDGVWYSVDVCFDDYSVYGDKTIYYTNFLKGDKTFGQTHTPDERYIYPSAPKDYHVK